MAEEARRKADEVFSDVKRKAAEFQEKNDVKGKVWTQLYISLGSIIAIISTIPSF
jgi:hypothetical protein